MKKKIFVLGWYGHGNLGDEAFRDSFSALWGDRCDFTFGDRLPQESDYDGMIIGGGSFLDQPIFNSRIPHSNLAFVGIGIHDKIHPDNLAALENAKVIITRNVVGTKLHGLCDSFYQASDLLFARKFDGMDAAHKRVLFIGNDFLSPRRHSPGWATTAYDWFCHEFSIACDRLIKDGYEVRLKTMSCGDYDDRRFNAKISSLVERKYGLVTDWNMPTEKELIDEILSSEVIISTRLHGSIFSAALCKGFVGINSHDKMKSFQESLGTENFLEYYGFKAGDLISKIESLNGIELRLRDYTLRERERWEFMSGIVSAKLGL